MTQPLIQVLADCRESSLCGGKAINLGRLIRAGLPVPDGFVLTTEAYRQRQHQADLFQQACAAWRQFGGGRVAVRSSATAEDLADASMAGQYETFLGIDSEESLVEAIGKCWASLDSPRTRSYLAEHGIEPGSVAMAVVVQRLVAADVAGILFSADPRTGSRERMLIEASWGLGEAVVSGLVQPDIFHLERASGTLLASTIAEKQILIDPATHVRREVEPGRRSVPCLDHEHLRSLWQLALRAAEHFGGEQDVEWAIEEGQVYLLQSRPITTLRQAETYGQLLRGTQEHLRQRLDAGRGPWVLHNLGETLNHPTPLTWSLIQPFMSGDGGFGSLYRQAGFAPSARIRREGFLERIGGRVYMDLSLSPEMLFEGYPYRYDLDKVRSDPDAGQAPPTVPAGSLRARIRAGRSVTAANQRLRELSCDLDHRLRQQIIPDFVNWCRHERLRDLSSLSDERLIELWTERAQRIMNEFAPQSLLPGLISAMALSEARSALEENLWDDDPDVLAAALSVPDEPDQTVLANAALYQVALGKCSLEQWLEEFGHRAPDEFDLASPRWRQRIGELQGMADRLRGGLDPLELHARHRREARERLEESSSRLPPQERQRLLEALDLARRYLIFREDGKHHLMLGYELLRDVAVEIGRRLGIGADVFQLNVDEAVQSLRSRSVDASVLQQRKDVYSAEERLSLPRVITAADIEHLGRPPQLPNAQNHTGLAVSSGVASGPARIVRSPSQAGDMGRGYILVCPSTDPGWTPLFVNAAGLVLECGGMLSHGAVVAREMSLPAVVLPDATRLLAEGEVVVVDGHHGRVSRPSSIGLGPSATAEGDALPRHLIPPPPGYRERWGRRLRSTFLVLWGIYLLGALLLPAAWIYEPSMAVLDAILWPLVRALGRPGGVAVLAATLAATTMLGQLFLTDNRRLRVAKARSALLSRRAATLPKDSPRRREMLALASSVQMRLVGASLVPLAVLLGPMVMSFLWLPQRVDPAVRSVPAGSPFSVVALVQGDSVQAIMLEVGAPLRLDPSSEPEQRPLPLRATLDRLLKQWEQADGTAALPWEIQKVAADDPQRKRDELRAFLARPLPPQRLSWEVRAEEGAAGRFPIVLRAADGSAVTLHAVLGETYPPQAGEVRPAGRSTLIQAEVQYPQGEQRPQFWAPLLFAPHRDFGWLGTYLLAYLPVMFILRWLLRIA